MKQDKVIEIMLENQSNIAETLSVMKETLIKINDQNAYHAERTEDVGGRAIKQAEANGRAIHSTCEVVKESMEVAKQTNTSLKIYGRVVMFAFIAMVFALIVIAGAEQSLHFLPNL